MSAPVADRSLWPFVASGLTVILVFGVVLGVVGDVLSPTVWIDVVALWPAAALGVAVGLVIWLARGRHRRHLAIPGLSLFSWLAIGLALHLSAAEWLPVSAADITGPTVPGLESARLAIDLGIGTVRVTGGAGAAYRVSPLRTGGNLGAPTAYEQERDTDLSVVVVPRPDPGAYVFGGWEVVIDASLTWSLDLTAPELDLDLSSIPVAAMSIEADSSRIHLGPPAGLPEVHLVGSHTLMIPDSVPATVTGSAVGPDGWTTSAGGLTSPAGGDGWRITIEPGSTAEILSG